MSSLGDFFPESERLEIINRNFAPGRILHLDVNFTNPPKPKYVLLLTCGDPCRLFVINKGLTKYIQSRPHLIPYQVKLEPASYPFFTDISYLDCSQSIRNMTEQEIKVQLMEQPSRIKLQINAKNLKEIIEVVKKSKTMNDIEINAIAGSLSSV